jgi:hypothetical protein
VLELGAQTRWQRIVAPTSSPALPTETVRGGVDTGVDRHTALLTRCRAWRGVPVRPLLVAASAMMRVVSGDVIDTCLKIVSFFRTPSPILWRHIQSLRYARNPFGGSRHVTATPEVDHAKPSEMKDSAAQRI